MTGTIKNYQCPIHKNEGHPDCNKCMKALAEMITKANGLLLSEDGDMIN